MAKQTKPANNKASPTATKRKMKVLDHETGKLIEKEVEVIDLDEGVPVQADQFKNNAIYRYLTDTGQKVEISADLIFFAHPQSKHALTWADCFLFLEECRIHRLHPTDDVWLIKRQSDKPARMEIKEKTELRLAHACDGYQGFEYGFVVGNGRSGRRYLKPKEEIPDGMTIIGAWCQAFRDGWKTPIEVALNVEHKQDNRMWKSMPETMVVKCARAKAHRAINKQMHGLYTEAEIGGHDSMANGSGQTMKALPQEAESQKIGNEILDGLNKAAARPGEKEPVPIGGCIAHAGDMPIEPAESPAPAGAGPEEIQPPSGYYAGPPDENGFSPTPPLSAELGAAKALSETTAKSVGSKEVFGW